MERTCRVPLGAAEEPRPAQRPRRYERGVCHEPAALVDVDATEPLSLPYRQADVGRRDHPLDERDADPLQPYDRSWRHERYGRSPVRGVRRRVDAGSVDRADVLVLDETPGEERLQIVVSAL